MTARNRLAGLLARQIHHHLREELQKPSSAVEFITVEGVPFKDLTAKMIADLEKEFPELLTPRELPFSLMQAWWDESNPAVPYAQSTFKTYNQLMLFRVLDLKHNSEFLRKKFEEKMIANGHALIGRGRNLGFETIFPAETRMLQMISRLARIEGIPDEETIPLLLDQLILTTQTAYRMFDSLFRESLNQTDKILKSVLPEKIADELKKTGKVAPVHVDSASVLFSDIVGFTRIAEELPPAQLLAELDRTFAHFEAAMKPNHLEKIKTIGDCFMCVGGISERNRLHEVDTVLAALRIQEFMRKYQKSRARTGSPSWKLRIGIHSGPVVAGVLGQERFNYDIWGDTVNVANRMESAGEPDTINIS
ncbi:MAG TPA: adenylate/guanylate cyclase domain-containing protein, partial [Leptospiraceae bacterium]|nr:adenylate/guanylate cyclase domain-containing protein [Leptospiraceae bacterium]